LVHKGAFGKIPCPTSTVTKQRAGAAKFDGGRIHYDDYGPGLAQVRRARCRGRHGLESGLRTKVMKPSRRTMQFGQDQVTGQISRSKTSLCPIMLVLRSVGSGRITQHRAVPHSRSNRHTIEHSTWYRDRVSSSAADRRHARGQIRIRHDTAEDTSVSVLVRRHSSSQYFF